jgi:hypothetical protein
MDENDAKSVENAIATAVTEAASDVAPKTSNEDVKLDAKAELFVRKITDSVTKAMANLLKPPPEEIEDDDAEDSHVKRKRRNPSAPPPPKKTGFFESLGL